MTDHAYAVTWFGEYPSLVFARMRIATYSPMLRRTHTSRFYMPVQCLHARNVQCSSLSRKAALRELWR
jgi:hypothetical protein